MADVYKRPPFWHSRTKPSSDVIVLRDRVRARLERELADVRHVIGLYTCDWSNLKAGEWDALANLLSDETELLEDLRRFCGEEAA